MFLVPVTHITTLEDDDTDVETETNTEDSEEKGMRDAGTKKAEEEVLKTTENGREESLFTQETREYGC